MVQRHDVAVVRDLRRARRERRLGDTEWFDVLYRVYLFALVGSIAVVIASDSIRGLVDDDVTTERLLARGPAIAGVAAALALGIGLRNGADGGPVSVESADVRHLLLAPVSRSRVLLRPIVQRLRSIAFPLALGFGIVGQLVAREVAGSRAAWAASGALFGVVLASLYVGGAVVAHATRLARWVASVASAGLVVWQTTAAWSAWTIDLDSSDDAPVAGPMNLFGSLLFWGIRQRGIDVIAIAIPVVLVAGALLLGGRLRLEPLERRGQLVSQLRFAATVQDIRTVVLLRRQLRAETVRSRSWLGPLGSPSLGTARPAATGATAPPHRPRRSGATSEPIANPLPVFVWRRGLTAIGRLPISRLLRIAALASMAGASASLAATASPLLLIPMVGAAFLVGLESIEPLAQEIDRPDLTDGLPVSRGWLFAQHLAAPACLLAVAGLIGATAATLIDPGHAAAAFGLAVPLAWAGAIGAVVATVKDAPDPPATADVTITGAQRGADSPFAMPEFAGFRNVATGALPVVLSASCALPVVALRFDPTFSTMWRTVIGVALCLTVLIWWVVRRDQWGSAIRSFFAEGRQGLGA